MTQKEISVAGGEYAAELKIQRASCPNCKMNFTIAISRGSHHFADFILLEEIAQVDDFQFAAGNTLVAFGRLSWAVSGIVIYDLHAQRMRDYFWCYKPSLSPDKHFLVYEKFFPQHSNASVSAEYLLYDLRKTAMQNRLQGIDNTDEIDAGLVIYPPGKMNRPGDNMGVPDADIHSMNSQGFY